MTSVVQLQQRTGKYTQKGFRNKVLSLLTALLPGQQGVGCRRPLTADMKGDLGSNLP